MSHPSGLDDQVPAEICIGITKAMGSNVEKLKAHLCSLLNGDPSGVKDPAGHSFGFRVVTIKLADIIRNLEPDFPSVRPIKVGTDGIDRAAPSYLGQARRDRMALIELGDHIRTTPLSSIAPSTANLAVLAASRAAESCDALIKSGSTRNAIIIESIMHPAEVNYLRDIFGFRFYLLAATDAEKARLDRLIELLATIEANHIYGNPSNAEVGNYRQNHEGALRRDARLLMQREEQHRRWFDGGTSKESCRCVVPDGADHIPRTNRAHVGKTFELADVFVDLSSYIGGDSGQRVVGQGNRFEGRDMSTVGRFLQLAFGAPDITPTFDEIGMASAFSASLGSGSLARRVGASLYDSHGRLIATGSNEVPAPGGGPYYPFYGPVGMPDRYRKYVGEDGGKKKPHKVWGGKPHVRSFRDIDIPRRVFMKEGEDNRAGYGIDSNDLYKGLKRDGIVEDLRQRFLSHLQQMCAQSNISEETRKLIEDCLDVECLQGDENFMNARAFDINEFTRTTHAEMHCLAACASGRGGAAGSVLFTTTFPCHECSSFMIAAGVERVVYIEPFPKSLVQELHFDAVKVVSLTGIGLFSDESQAKMPVKMVPFEGIAPMRQQELYSWIDRKEKYSGRAKDWDIRPTRSMRTDTLRMPVLAESSSQAFYDQISSEIASTHIRARQGVASYKQLLAAAREQFHE